MILEALKDKPVKGLPLDNGPGFAGLQALEKQPKAPIPFAGLHRPWQRGCNGNAHGLLRYSYPRGCNFLGVSQAGLGRVLNLASHSHAGDPTGTRLSGPSPRLLPLLDNLPWNPSPLRSRICRGKGDTTEMPMGCFNIPIPVVTTSWAYHRRGLGTSLIWPATGHAGGPTGTRLSGPSPRLLPLLDNLP